VKINTREGGGSGISRKQHVNYSDDHLEEGSRGFHLWLTFRGESTDRGSTKPKDLLDRVLQKIPWKQSNPGAEGTSLDQAKRVQSLKFRPGVETLARSKSRLTSAE